MKILVSGCAGYIGSRLCQHLCREGFEVVGVDTLVYLSNSREAIHSLLLEENFTFHHLDCRHENYTALAHEADAVVHLAALAGSRAFRAKPKASSEIDRGVIEKLTESLPQEKKIVWLNTDIGYPPSRISSADEKAYLYPLDSYGQMKVHTEFALTSRENYVSFRCASTFGMSLRMRLDLSLNDLLYRGICAYHNWKKDFYIPTPNLRLSLISILDVVRAITWAIQHNKKGVYNLCYPEFLTFRQLADKVMEVVPKLELKQRENEPSKQTFTEINSDKIRQEGFEFSPFELTLKNELSKMFQLCLIRNKSELASFNNDKPF